MLLLTCSFLTMDPSLLSIVISFASIEGYNSVPDVSPRSRLHPLGTLVCRAFFLAFLVKYDSTPPFVFSTSLFIEFY